VESFDYILPASDEHFGVSDMRYKLANYIMVISSMSVFEYSIKIGVKSYDKELCGCSTVTRRTVYDN
jgi:hypothetical protein